MDVNNSGWSKSSSEGDGYFCVVFHLRQKDGTSVRCMNESRYRGENEKKRTKGEEKEGRKWMKKIGVLLAWQLKGV